MKAMRIGKPILVLTTIGVLVVGSDSPVAAGTATANLQINATVSANGFHRDQFTIGDPAAGCQLTVGLQVQPVILGNRKFTRETDVDFVEHLAWDGNEPSIHFD